MQPTMEMQWRWMRGARLTPSGATSAARTFSSITFYGMLVWESLAWRFSMPPNNRFVTSLDWPRLLFADQQWTSSWNTTSNSPAIILELSNAISRILASPCWKLNRWLNHATSDQDGDRAWSPGEAQRSWRLIGELPVCLPVVPPGDGLGFCPCSAPWHRRWTKDGAVAKATGI